MHQIFAAAGRPDKTHYLFLGDYVDRGPRQLETICCLLAWKICYPYQVGGNLGGLLQLSLVPHAARKPRNAKYQP